MHVYVLVYFARVFFLKYRLWEYVIFPMVYSRYEVSISCHAQAVLSCVPFTERGAPYFVSEKSEEKGGGSKEQKERETTRERTTRFRHRIK